MQSPATRSHVGTVAPDATERGNIIREHLFQPVVVETLGPEAVAQIYQHHDFENDVELNRILDHWYDDEFEMVGVLCSKVKRGFRFVWRHSKRVIRWCTVGHLKFMMAKAHRRTALYGGWAIEGVLLIAKIIAWHTLVLPWWMWPVLSFGLYFIYLRVLPQSTRLELTSDFISHFASERPRVILDCIRSRIRWTPLTDYRAAVNNHAHPVAADLRCQATTTIDKAIRRINVEMKLSQTKDGKPATQFARFDVATSSRERKFGVRGNRLIYDDSDLNQEPKFDRINKKIDFVSFIDVDYYVEDWTVYVGCPILLYTRMPNQIAQRDNESTVLLDHKEGSVIMTEVVDGTAKWESKVWDYSPDVVVMHWKYGLGFTTYAVEKIKQPKSKSRYLVALIPKYNYYAPWRFLRFAYKVMGLDARKVLYYPLRRSTNVWRENPDGKEVTLGRFRRDAIDYIDIRNSDCCDHLHSSVRTSDFISMRQLCRRDPNNACNSNVKAWFPGLGYAKIPTSPCTTANTMLWARLFMKDTGYIADPQMLNYVFIDEENPLEEGKAKASIVGEPITTSTIQVPTECRANEVKAVQSRVIDKINDVEPPDMYNQYMTEFIKAIASNANLYPVQEMDVINHMRRPLQVARMNRYKRHGTLKKNVVNSFQKLEGYGEIKDPRVISAVQDSHTVKLGTYMYSMKYYLGDKFDWFMPCRNPLAFASAIHKFCEKRKFVAETDYTRFDGTISQFLTQVEHGVYRKAFNSDYHEELEQLLEQDRNLEAYTKTGVNYNTKWSRLSGSQSTTIGNTLINAFVAFSALRNAGYGSDESMSLIGPKYGDDGIDQAINTFEETGADLGLEVKVIKRRTDDFVTFCGRYYLRPKFSQSSIFNVKKGVMSVPVVLKDEDWAHQAKVTGYLACDPYTPLLSDYCKALLRVLPKVYSDAALYKYIQMDKDVAFKVFTGPYPFTRADQEHAKHVISRELGLCPGEIGLMCNRLRAARSLADIRKIPKIDTLLEPDPSKKVRYVRKRKRPQVVKVHLKSRKLGKSGRDGRAPKTNEQH
jgi:hypothetical protein